MNDSKAYDIIITDLETIAKSNFSINDIRFKKFIECGKFIVNKVIDKYLSDKSIEFNSLKTVEIPKKELCKFNTSIYIKETKQRLPVLYSKYISIMEENGIIYVNHHYGEKDGKHFSKSYGLTFEYAYMLKGEILGELSPEKYAKKLFWLCTTNDIIREYWHCSYDTFWKATLNETDETIKQFIADTKERMNDYDMPLDSTLFDIWNGELIFPRKYLIKHETEEEMKQDLDKYFP